MSVLNDVLLKQNNPLLDDSIGIDGALLGGYFSLERGAPYPESFNQPHIFFAGG